MSFKAHRPAGAARADYLAAKDYEAVVEFMLGPGIVSYVTSNTELDFHRPGYYLDVKERKSNLSDEWDLPPGCSKDDAFVIDELSVRKALRHYPAAYFWLHECQTDRVFLARIDEVVCGNHTRQDREVDKNGSLKGKWVVDLNDFRELDQIQQPMVDVLILEDLAEMSWKQSPLLIGVS